MEKRINIYGAKTYLSELINQVQEAGMPCTICLNNQPVVNMVLHQATPKEFDPLKQDPVLKGSSVYLCDPLESTEDLWPEEYR